MTTLRLFIALLALASIGCATRRVPGAGPAPAPIVSTGALAARIADTKERVGSANARTETVIKTVEKIITQTDPITAGELTIVKADLFKVQTDLREANEACTKAVMERETAQEAADKLESWGVEQQRQAEVNAEGWRKAEAKSAQREMHILRLQSLIGIALGIAAGIAGLKFFGPYGAAAGPIVWLLTYFLA